MKSLVLFSCLLAMMLALSIHHEAAAKKPLLGEWTLTQVQGVAPSVPTKVTFSAEQISLKYCNFMSMPYTIKGSKITVKMAMSTRMACTADLTPPQNKVSEAFTNAKKWQISKKLLTLYGDKKQVLARLQK